MVVDLDRQTWWLEWHARPYAAPPAPANEPVRWSEQDEIPLQPPLAEERRAVNETMGTPDALEGMRAFLEKRPPRFHEKA